MALKPLNSVAGFSVGETPANIILANGDVTTNNITTTGKANLNAIGNVIITGGTNTQVIQTDGAGNLSFVTINTSLLANGNSNVQVLANGNITFSSAGTANNSLEHSIRVVQNIGLAVTGSGACGPILREQLLLSCGVGESAAQEDTDSLVQTSTGSNGSACGKATG